jgi:hypothetical protein
MHFKSCSGKKFHTLEEQDLPCSPGLFITPAEVSLVLRGKYFSSSREFSIEKEANGRGTYSSKILVHVVLILSIPWTINYSRVHSTTATKYFEITIRATKKFMF